MIGEYFLCEEHLKIDRSKGKTEIMNANMREFGKRSF